MATARDVKNRLRRPGWSQRQLAEAMGVSDTYVSPVVHGESPVTNGMIAVMHAAVGAMHAVREAV